MIKTRFNKLLWFLGFAACAQAFAEPVPEIDCLIEPNMIIELSSPVAGVLDTITVDRSDTVARGQVVATLKSDVDQVKLRTSQANLDASLVEQKRAIDLYRDNVITLSEKEEADHAVALNRLEVESSLANLELRKIRSPIDAVIADRYLMPGEFIEDNPILKLAQLDPLRVEVVAPVAYFGRISPGMHAQVKTEFGSFENLVAEVVVVDKVIDAASGTFGIRLELENRDNRVPGGLKCSVRFFNEQEEADYALTHSERGDAAAVTTPAVTDQENVPDGPQTICRRLGPFKDKERLLAVMGALETRIDGYEIRDEKATDNAYRVEIAELASYQEARAVDSELKESGVKDIAIIKREGDYSISLGVFRREQSAGKRQASIQDMGYDCRVVAQPVSKTLYWAEVTTTTSEDELSQLVAGSGVKGVDTLLYQSCSTEILASWNRPAK